MTMFTTNDIPRYVSSNMTEIAEDIIFVKVPVILLYTLIAVIGLAGNLMVVVVVARTKSIRTVTNIFIANLALSDILMCTVATPFTPVSLYMKSWTLPEVVCKLLPITMGISVHVSTLTSMAIALDRFFLIVHPFLPRMRIWLCLTIIFTIWTIAFIISLPLAVYQQKRYVPETETWACQENWPKETAREIFTVVSFMLQFVFPCGIISACYVKISRVLRVRLQTKVVKGMRSRLHDFNEIRRKRRTNTMLIVMVVVFVICWIPLNTLLLTLDAMPDKVSNEFHESRYFSLAFFICHLLAMSSAVYNPFLYAWMNEGFRRELRRIFPCTRGRNTQTLSSSRTNVANSGSPRVERRQTTATIFDITSTNIETDNSGQPKNDHSTQSHGAQLNRRVSLA